MTNTIYKKLLNVFKGGKKYAKLGQRGLLN